MKEKEKRTGRRMASAEGIYARNNSLS